MASSRKHIGKAMHRCAKSVDWGAEQFVLECGPIEPGSVVVLSDEGRIVPSGVPYDKRVAGVVSGAGGYRPGLTLEPHEARTERLPVALMGKVYCRAEADSGPIEVGEMLTTSRPRATP